MFAWKKCFLNSGYCCWGKIKKEPCHWQAVFIGVIYEVLIAPQTAKQWCESYLLWLDMYNRLMISSGRLWWCRMRILSVITCESGQLWTALFPWCCYWSSVLIILPFTASLLLYMQVPHSLKICPHRCLWDHNAINYQVKKRYWTSLVHLSYLIISQIGTSTGK